jgi:hypothetical protein
MAEHLIEVFGGPVKRRRMALPVENLHRVFHGVCMARATERSSQLVGVGSTCSHAAQCENKARTFKALVVLGFIKRRTVDTAFSQPAM